MRFHRLSGLDLGLLCRDALYHIYLSVSLREGINKNSCAASSVLPYFRFPLLPFAGVLQSRLLFLIWLSSEIHCERERDATAKATATSDLIPSRTVLG